MTSEYTVYRAADGSLAYDGLPWAELSDDERTARIKECYVLKYSTYEEIAATLRIFKPNGKGNAEAIRIHLTKFRIIHPKVVSQPPKPTGARRNVMSYSGPKLSGDKLLERIRTQTESGKAFVAKEAEGSAPGESYWEKLKKQKGFCVAITSLKDTSGNYTGEYCGEETGSPHVYSCKGHRPDTRGRNKPDLRGRIWMKLKPASK